MSAGAGSFIFKYYGNVSQLSGCRFPYIALTAYALKKHHSLALALKNQIKIQIGQ